MLRKKYPREKGSWARLKFQYRYIDIKVEEGLYFVKEKEGI
jgi:hypothetical protein